MAEFGGITCTIIDGDPSNQQEALDRWEVPGLDGVGLQAHGKRPVAGRVNLVYLGTLAGAASWRQAIDALAGSMIEYVTSAGVTYTGVLVKRTSLKDGKFTAAYRPGTSQTTRAEIVVDVEIIT